MNDPTPRSGLILTAGKQYVDRKGNTWTVLSVRPGWAYPAQAKSGEMVQSFTIDGRWSRHTEWPNDLMGEASDVVEAKAA